MKMGNGACERPITHFLLSITPGSEYERPASALVAAFVKIHYAVRIYVKIRRSFCHF